MNSIFWGPKKFFEKAAGSLWGVALAIALYLLLTAAIATVQKPNDEEMLHANIGATFMREGRIACPIWDWAGETRWQNYDKHFYSMPPNIFVLMGAWFKVWGVSLMSLRFFSVFWGLVGLGSWWFFSKSLGIQNRKVLFMTTLLIATDFIYTRFATGRPFDVTVDAVLPMALGSYLYFRERSLSWAILVSQAITVFAGTMHPNGMLIWLELAFLTVVLDVKNLRWKHLLFFLIPYLVGGAGMAYYVTRDWATFKLQFFKNVKYSGETGMWNGVWKTFRSEFGVAYGFTIDVPVKARALILILAAYFFSIGYALKNLRTQFPVKITLLLLLIHFITFTFIFTHKWPAYVTYFIPLFALAVAFTWNNLSEKSPKLCALFSWVICSMILMSFAATAFRVRKDEYHKLYLPDMARARELIPASDLVYANAETAFDLGMERVRRDSTMGYFSKEKRKFILVDPMYESIWRWYQTDNPDVYNYIQNLLEKEYRLIYTGNIYKIYQKI